MRLSNQTINKLYNLSLDREKLYDRLYDIADFLLKKHNPCNIKDDTCGDDSNTNFCCSGCRHLTNTGCSTRALYCKVWVCGYSEHSMVTEQLAIIRDIAHKFNLLKVRSNKDETFNPNHIGRW